MAIQALMVILAVLLALLFLGVPISYAIAVSSLTAILSSIDLNVAVLTAAQRTFVGMSKFSLTAIPFFILAGNIMNQGGIAKRLVDFVMSILGKLPGALLITNIGTMHIEHLGSREGILQAKLEIFRGVPENGVGVFNGDEPLLWNVRADGGHKKYYYGIENHACDVLATDIQELDDGMRFVVSGFGHRFELFVPVLGRHTVYNTLAAVTAALLLKVPPETIQTQISGFHNTGMRQRIYERDGFTIIEDCYNAGPESTEAALEILAGFRSRTNGRCIAVLGDMLELGNRSAAEHYRIGRIAATKADVLYTYGVNAERMVSGAITGGMKQKLIEHFDTHEDLAHMLKMRARPGDVILFKGSRGMRMEKALALFFKEEEE